ncbi:MAG: PKD domain-containing protein [Candidatus Thermoplasmatota archaeon]|nr:PKD domain-containing protein [Candidatus Thermoplasmatota archaeon]
MHGRLDGSRRAVIVIVTLVLTSFSPLVLGAANSGARSTTVWSGTVILQDGYTVESGEVLVVQSGTTIQLGDDERIIVAGRLTVQGTSAAPVLIESIIGNHHGIVFNSSSGGLGSKVENLTITDAEWGVTIYDSDPTLNDLIIVNADRVAVDLFEGSSPRINNLVIDGGGQNLHGISTSWRYGIGLSVGDYSTPIVDGVIADGLITRAVNYWGNSGGLVSNLQISNVSGATLGIAAGIWVEDSIPLISDSTVTRCDNGIYVRHITSGWNTRPNFVSITVEDSQYRGVMVEQYNHSQFSNVPHNAIFTDLELRGTGGPGAKTPGLAYAAFEVNTSGVRVTDALIEDNTAVGFKAYMIGPSTILNDIELHRNGATSPAALLNDRAGLFMRSANGAPTINDLVVSNSTGPGVLLWKGGVQGADWVVSDNGETGVDLREFHPEISGILSLRNGGHGVSVRDSSNVELSYVSTYQNGLGVALPELGAGIYFDESNDVMSGGKNVSCFECTSIQDQHGIVVRDSIDLQLLATEIRDPVSGPALDIDNSGMGHHGTVIIDDLRVATNSSTHAIKLDEVDGFLRDVDLSGDNGGMLWDADGKTPSSLENSFIVGNSASCLDLIDHTELQSDNVALDCDPNSPATMSSSFANFSDSWFSFAASDTFEMLGNSHLRWISSSDIGTPTYTGSDNIVDVMWMVEVHAVNQNLLHIPFAEVNMTFDLYESEHTATLPYAGVESYGPFIGERWTPMQGWSNTNVVYTGCDYDGVHNDSTSADLISDLSIYCRLELQNQPPFIIWNTPSDEEVFASGSTVSFDASSSWDLDLDNLTYSWTSSIDGDIASACGPFIGNGSVFEANSGASTCLSDGVHQITLEICDPSHCVQENREVELVNLPPVLSVGTTPGISAWGTLYLGITANVSIHLGSTYDPEDDELSCWVETSYGGGSGQPPAGDPECPNTIITSFPGAPNQFSVTVYASDGVNAPISWTFNVELYNEIPEARMQVIRAGQMSSDIVRLDGAETFDPEGDAIRFEFWSDRDGLLASGVTPDSELVWEGTLSKGDHEITMHASDDLANHAGIWSTVSEELTVTNSPPVAIIASPSDGILTDSGELLLFDATGSGDWDAACIDLPDNGSGLVCNPYTEQSTDLVSVLWESDKLSEPMGSGWALETRLPEGVHQVTLTVEDGSGASDSYQIMVRVDEAAPVLVLDSPMPDIEVYSNLPVLFDFRRSFDPDGDDFTVSIFSDIMLEPILEDKDTSYWYNDYLPAGEHTLRFELIDSTGMQRVHSQTLTVLETGPVAGIAGLSEGQYVPPGEPVVLDASASYDYDDDIILYQWSLSDGTLLSDKEVYSVTFPPGPVRVELLVKDSRGATSSTSINLTIGSSSPQLYELEVSPLVFETDNPTPVLITVRLVDPDGTTSTVRGELRSSGVSQALEFRDDGAEGDQFANDGIWTYLSIWTLSGSNARVEVWALDGDTVSPGLVEIVQVDSLDENSMLDWLMGSGLPFLIVMMTLAIMAGIAYVGTRRRQIAKDLDMIESWSGFDPRELDEEFDDQNLP